MPHIPPVNILIAIGLLFASHASAQGADPPVSMLTSYNLAEKNPPTARLPRELREVSGLAASRDGKVFCHNDERGLVYQINPGKGTILSQFSVGDRVLRQDYEGLAVAESLMFLITSNGKLYQFSEATPNGRAEITEYATGLGSGWDIEGLCYDPSTRSLLLACKENPVKKRLRYIYAFSLKTHSLESAPRFIIDLEKLEKKWKIKQFRPSSIERHPISGSFFVLSSSDPAILEVSAAGGLLAAVSLRNAVHRQPEGLTFGADLTMYICNEGKDHGIVVRYPYLR